jgi:hypothetical protein
MLVIFGFGGFLMVAAGCVRERVVYVPSNPNAAPPAAADVQTPPMTPPASAGEPPPPQQEVVPVAPGPAYVWAPGYWGWNHGWVWMGGSWMVRPHSGAVWIGPRWVRHGRHYVWVRGRWR